MSTFTHISVSSLAALTVFAAFTTRAAAPTAAAETAQPVPMTLSSSARVNCYTTTDIGLTVKIGKASSPKITYVLVTPPQHGTVKLPTAYSLYRGTISAKAVYTSTKDYVGKDAFEWKVTEGAVESKLATCSLDVREAAPVPIPQSVAACVEGNSTVDIPIEYSGGGNFTYTFHHSVPSNGTLSLEGSAFKYTPRKDFVGTDSFAWHMTYSSDKFAARTTTPLTCSVVVKKPGMTDWPQYRADEYRSGYTTMALPAKLRLQWQRDIPETRSPFIGRGANVYPDLDYCRPVQLGKTLFVPITASDCLAACSTETGALHWKFYASGAVRRPPAAFRLSDGKEAVIFGSDDGWIYCLNAADGSIRWKFHAAPNNRTAMGFGRLSSVWPIWASPIISRGKVYFVAGYIPSFALYGYCLDAATGQVQWTNDGRITDMWNTSTFGPLAISYDNTKIYGSVEGASRPWVLNSADGEFLGHVGLGYEFPGSGNQRGRDTQSNGSCGWYVDGKGSFNIPEPMTITAGTKAYTPTDVEALGVTGTVASLLAGDNKLFVTTAEGSIYCFAGKQAAPQVHPLKTIPLPVVTDKWTDVTKNMLSRDDLKQGLALVLGIENGRLVEELARQSSLMIVAVDPDHRKLQALRARMDAAGLSGARVSTLEGHPMDFAFSPYQAALITSEDAKLASAIQGQRSIEKLYTWARPFGGEIWIPTSDAQNTTIEGHVKASQKMPLSEAARTGGFTQIKRTGLPDEALRIRPPFGLIAFGSDRPLAASSPLHWVWNNKDLYTGLPLTAKTPGYVPPMPKENALKGYPTVSTVSTTNSVFSSMINPLFGTIEKFPGVPSSGNDGSCTAIWCRYGDFGLTHGKISSFFDTSSNYWGRLFFPEAGGCPGHIFMWNGILSNAATPVPGSTCGCSPAMQFTTFFLAPMENEENWINYQRVRTSNPIEARPIRRVGINFGAPGDRFDTKTQTLWTHHPYAGRYGRCSYNFEAEIEAPPLVPVSYSGNAKSVYRHSAQMKHNGAHGWVAASCVNGMTEITIPLAQPAVATRTVAAPKVDGALDDECWKKANRLIIMPDKTAIDRDKTTGQPGTKDHCYAMLCYDDANLYIAGGAQVRYGSWWTVWQADERKHLTVTLNNRDRSGADVVLTGAETTSRNKTTVIRKSTGTDTDSWSFACATTETKPFTAEMVIPWKALMDAGLTRNSLVINIVVSDSPLTPQFTPLYLDKARGAGSKPRTHTVRLYFAEMTADKPGQRVFDVSLQGQPVLKNLDVLKEASGPKRELVKEFKNVTISDTLRIGFVPRAGEPMLSGVEIIGNYDHNDRSANARPVAVIEASAVSGSAPLAVTFDARKSEDPDGQIVQYMWDAGDGHFAEGAVLDHVFPEPGTYRVRLRVRDNRGDTVEKDAAVKVTPGRPAAFVCTVRAKGGDYANLSSWESAMKSDLTASVTLFTVSSMGSYKPSDNGQTITFQNGASGILRSVKDNVAAISGITGKPEAGMISIPGGHKLGLKDIGVSAGKSLLFSTKSLGTYAPADDGAAVTFTGGGTGTLRHINKSKIAYITECKGTIQPGPVTSASGHSFEVGDTGQPVYTVVAECYNDWPTGLVDTVEDSGPGWITDPLHRVIIRAAGGKSHGDTMKNVKGHYSGFALKGPLNIRHIPRAQIKDIIIDSALSAGPGSSVSRVLAGKVTLLEHSIAAHTTASILSAGNSQGVTNRSISSYTVDLRDGRKQPKPPKWIPSLIRFYKCTAATFDPGGEPDVEFLGCRTSPGGRGFMINTYYEPASVYRDAP